MIYNKQIYSTLANKSGHAIVCKAIMTFEIVQIQISSYTDLLMSGEEPLTFYRNQIHQMAASHELVPRRHTIELLQPV